jgi:NhaB family Na+:H+ antiporter
LRHRAQFFESLGNTFMPRSLAGALAHNFLGQSPRWYKATLCLFLLLNPLLLFTLGPVVTGWVLVVQFIFTLGMALKCYPLMPGGLLLVEALLLGMTTPQALYEELQHNFPVILLLMFMVAGIYFMKDLLLFAFSRILLGIKSKSLLSMTFCFLSAFLSAFLDALTVTAVIISAAVGFYAVYHRVTSGSNPRGEAQIDSDQQIPELAREDLQQFRAFLRSLLMHGAVGTALGGVCTLVGEPQNLLIGHEMGWHFQDFFLKVAPVSLPVLAAGLVTCVLLEKLRWFGYGTLLPDRVRQVLAAYAAEDDAQRTAQQRAALLVQGIAALILIRSGADRPAGNRADHLVHRYHRRAPPGPGVPGRHAVHLAAGGVLRRGRGDSSAGAVHPADPGGAGAAGGAAAGHAVHRQRPALGHQR